MPNKELEEVEEKIERAREKIRSYVNLGWLIVLAFLIVGMFTSKRDTAVVGLFLVGICWITNEILTRGITAMAVIFKKTDDDQNNEQGER